MCIDISGLTCVGSCASCGVTFDTSGVTTLYRVPSLSGRPGLVRMYYDVSRYWGILDPSLLIRRRFCLPLLKGALSSQSTVNRLLIQLGWFTSWNCYSHLDVRTNFITPLYFNEEHLLKGCVDVFALY